MESEIFYGDSCVGENYSDVCWLQDNCPDENSTRNFELHELEMCMNQTSCYRNATSTDEGFSLTAKIAIYILYNTVFIAAVLGNVLVCYVVFSSPRMRTVTNYLIANLALGDLFMAVLCVPFSYIPVLYQFWPFGQVLCHVLSPAQAVCVFVSAYTLVALAGDRYMAILYPLRPRLRRSQAVMVIFFVWIIAILTATPIAIFTSLKLDHLSCNPRCGEEDWPDLKLKLYYSLALMILQYFFPLVVLVFTYTRIAVAVWGKKAPGEAEDGRDRRLARSKRKTVVMMVVVVAGYTLAWLPMNCMNLVMDLFPHLMDEPTPSYFKYVFVTCHWLAMAHTTYNPLIYAWINSRFRTAFRATLAKMIKMMLTVVIVYTISWLPFNVIMVCADVQGQAFWEWMPLQYIYSVTHWLAMSHTVWNPVIYCWMNSRFRVGFRSAVSRLPIIKRLIMGYNLNDYNYRLERMGTCTTFSFAGGNTTLTRGSSVISNRTTFSEAGFTNSPHLVTDRLLDRDRSGARNSTGSNNNSPFTSANNRRSFSLSPRLNNNGSPFNTIVSCNSNVHNSPGGSHTTATMLPSSGLGGRRAFTRRDSITESFM